jgi:Family of unknown function (DUF5996)
MNARKHPEEVWPALPLAPWQDTLATLHMWTQIVGKTRLALAPMTNHWWQVTLYVTARGLSTSPMSYQDRSFEVDFDFIDHLLSVRTSGGDTRTLPLIPRPVAEFHREYFSLLRSLGLEVKIRPVPVEVQEAIPFPADQAHRSYDPDAAQRCFRILAQVDRVLKEFRGRFVGKASPVHFWWGSFDIACTLFSGQPAPRHPGGIPNCPDYVALEAYSHECISAGWWPGAGLGEPAFYAYAYPEPAGLGDARLQPSGAYYSRELREFVLPYEAVRVSPRPDETLLAFLQSTYEGAANLAHWDRAALERPA